MRSSLRRRRAGLVPACRGMESRTQRPSATPRYGTLAPGSARREWEAEQVASWKGHLRDEDAIIGRPRAGVALGPHADAVGFADPEGQRLLRQRDEELPTGEGAGRRG